VLKSFAPLTEYLLLVVLVTMTATLITQPVAVHSKSYVSAM
jgi:hypothetical protein